MAAVKLDWTNTENTQ